MVARGIVLEIPRLTVECTLSLTKFKLTSEAKIQPVFTVREDMPVAFDFSHRGHALVYALIGQNLTGKFMRKIYSAS